MRLRSALSFAMAGLLALSLTNDAFAGKKGGDDAANEFTIEDVGVAKVDQFYDGVETQVANMKGAQEDMDNANAKLAEALGLGEGTPVADALNDLADKAGDKVELVLDGTKPTLKPADACPENVKEAVNAANAMVESLVAAVVTLKDVAKATAAMVPQAGDMPGAIKDSSLGAVDKAKAIKLSASNLKSTKQLAEEAKILAGQCEETLELVKTTFGG